MSLDIAVVLSAGQGIRMGSSLPKSLHPLAGSPILARILSALKQAHFDETYVIINSEHQHLIQPVTDSFKAKLIFQSKKKGTASAVSSLPLNENHRSVFIVNGDHPLLHPEDIQKIRKEYEQKQADLCIGSYITEEPGDYGRILRQNEQVIAIAEKDSLTHRSRQIKEINAGIYLINGAFLKTNLSQINNQNPKKEYYLTDIVSIAVKQNKKVFTCLVSKDSAFGINTQKELAFATKKVFTKKLHQLMQEGVIIIDPLNTYIEDTVQIGSGAVVYPGVYLKGKTSIGSFCAIEPNSFIADSILQELTLIRAGSYLESADIGSHCVIGPYARLRPGTKIGNSARVGNFVEMKNTHFGSGSKASHLSYLGDAQIGEKVNIGCGVVTCNLNLDGKKYPTSIGDKVFVGSGSQLVAPVKIEQGSAIGAGSVITKDVPAGSLALERSEQKTIKDYLKK